MGHIVALEIKNGQMLKEAHVKQVVYAVVREVELFQVVERLDTLDFSQLTALQVQEAHEAEGGAEVSEALDDGITHPERLKPG